MTIVVIVLVIALAALAWVHFGPRIRRPSRVAATSPRRILFPFVAADLSSRALDAALRLARAEGATLVPVFLARVPLQLPLDSPLPRQCDAAIPLLEAIEQRARRFDVPVDSRIERGRTNRHALSQTIASERFDRIVIAAADDAHHGFDADDVAWLLRSAPGEIVVLRPSQEERITPPPPRRRWTPRPRGDVHGEIRAGASA
jgi:nucleotide-binding universal stress UspA family protein